MKDTVIALGNLVKDHKGNDVTVLDMTGLNSWTDYFVIATVNSPVHALGIYKAVKDFAAEHDLSIHFGHQRKQSTDDQWLLIDMGNVVVHLMLDEARKFYNLENLWYESKVLMSSGDEKTAEDTVQ